MPKLICSRRVCNNPWNGLIGDRCPSCKTGEGLRLTPERREERLSKKTGRIGGTGVAPRGDVSIFHKVIAHVPSY